MEMKINLYQEIRDRLDKIMEATEALHNIGKMRDLINDPEIMCMLTPLDYAPYIMGYIRNKVTCIQSIVNQMEFDAADCDGYTTGEHRKVKKHFKALYEAYDMIRVLQYECNIYPNYTIVYDEENDEYILTYMERR